MILGFSVVNLWDGTVAPSSRYTPVVISTSTTSHLWKKKRGLVLVVFITTYQPRLVFALKAANLYMSYRGLAAHTHCGTTVAPGSLTLQTEHSKNQNLANFKIRYMSEKVLQSLFKTH